MRKFLGALGLAACAFALSVSGAQAHKRLHCIRHVHHHRVHHAISCNCNGVRIHHNHHIQYSEGETLPPPPPEVRYVEAPPPPPRVVYVQAPPPPPQIVYVYPRIIGYRFVQGPPPMMYEGGYGYGYRQHFGYRYDMHRRYRVVRLRRRWDLPY